MPLRKLREFLDGQNVKYVLITHSKAYTSQEIAALSHTPGKELAKTVMVQLDDRMAMAVLPATQKVDLDKLRKASGAKKAALAHEEDFKGMFPECEAGAMPPFGNLFGMDVFVAPRLAEDREIAFNAGSHTELVRMPYKDFERLVKPRMMEFAL